MPGPAQLTVIDLVLAVALVLVVAEALRSGRGPFAAVGSGLVATLVTWLAAGALLSLGPDVVRQPLAETGFVRAADPPTWAFDRVADATRTPGPRP